MRYAYLLGIWGPLACAGVGAGVGLGACSSAYHTAAGDFHGPLDERLAQRLEEARASQEAVLGGVRAMERSVSDGAASLEAYRITEPAAWELRRRIASVGDIHGRLEREAEPEGLADLLLEMTAAASAVDASLERYEAVFIAKAEPGPEAVRSLEAQLGAAATVLESSLARTAAMLGG